MAEQVTLNGTSQATLQEADPELYDIIVDETVRQAYGLEMIASENFTSRAVIDCLGTILTNKYSEGLPGKRYYGGTVNVDRIETLCQKRALEAFGLTAEDWGVNVQPYSGSTANWCVYVGLLNPHDRIMGLDLPSGGHLTHGFYTAKTRVSATSVFFESLPYKVDPATGLIDYDAAEKLAELFRPKMIICGASAYPRVIDFERFRKIADKVGALLMADIAHISGLVAAGVHPSPFPYCDVVTTTTHKSLRGPRSGIIFSKKRRSDGTATEFPSRIDSAVFPSVQGGPHNHQIAAVATQLREVATPEFKQYAADVFANTRALCEAMVARKWELMTGGSDNHLVLWNVRALGLTGSKVERALELVGISTNKNAIVGDQSALVPGGIRLGTCALTTRGFKPSHMADVVDLIAEAIDVALDVQSKLTSKLLVDFSAAYAADERIAAIAQKVKALAGSFPFPGLTPEMAQQIGVPY